MGSVPSLRKDSFSFFLPNIQLSKLLSDPPNSSYFAVRLGFLGTTDPWPCIAQGRGTQSHVLPSPQLVPHKIGTLFAGSTSCHVSQCLTQGADRGTTGRRNLSLGFFLWRSPCTLRMPEQDPARPGEH